MASAITVEYVRFSAASTGRFGMNATPWIHVSISRHEEQTRSEVVVHGLNSRAGQTRHGTHKESRSERYWSGGRGRFWTNTLMDGAW